MISTQALVIAVIVAGSYYGGVEAYKGTKILYQKIHKHWVKPKTPVTATP